VSSTPESPSIADSSTVDERARDAGSVRLAVGVVALEFAAAVQSFVGATLLPAIAADLHASVQLGLLLAGGTLGMFLALPLAPRLVGRLGYRRGLAVALPLSLTGLAVASAAGAPWEFALGRLTAGFAGGLLAVFGLGAVIERLDEAVRVRVVAAQSAMWIVPALVGPPATLALEHLVGWRLALLLPLPFVLCGRLLLARGAVPARARAAAAPGGRALLVPGGIAVLVAGSSVWHVWPLVVAGSGIAAWGIAAILPAGTFRARPGVPAALAAMVLFGLGYFGADSLIPVLFTTGYGQPVSRAAVALAVAPLAWAVTSGVLPRVRRRSGGLPSPAAGLGLTATGTAALAGLLATPSWAPVAIAAWALAGVGVGLAYPSLFIGGSTPTADGPPAAVLAAAVLTAEAFGTLVGQSAGGGIVSTALAAGTGTHAAYAIAYALFAACLLAAARAAARARPGGAGE
jgi:Major Facilitator Superfamily